VHAAIQALLQAAGSPFVVQVSKEGASMQLQHWSSSGKVMPALVISQFTDTHPFMYAMVQASVHPVPKLFL
jgi:hypothetical protein